MEIFRFVHVSDIHFGQECEGNIHIHNDVRYELLRDSAYFRGKHGGATGILVTGDIAFSGKPAQYKTAGEWLDNLSEITGCEKTSVFVVPGNHDIDLEKLGVTGKILHNSIRESPFAERHVVPHRRISFLNRQSSKRTGVLFFCSSHRSIFVSHFLAR